MAFRCGGSFIMDAGKGLNVSTTSGDVIIAGSGGNNGVMINNAASSFTMVKNDVRFPQHRTSASGHHHVIRARPEAARGLSDVVDEVHSAAECSSPTTHSRSSTIALLTASFAFSETAWLCTKGSIINRSNWAS